MRRYVLFYLPIFAFFWIYLANVQTDLEAITASNAHQLIELYQLGNGTLDKVMYSPDGHWLAASGSKGIWLFETATPEQTGRLLPVEELNSRITQIAFSSDGEALISLHMDAVHQRRWLQYWNMESGEVTNSLEVTVAMDNMIEPAFNVRSGLLAFTAESNVYVWDIVQQTTVFTFAGNGGTSHQTAFSPDGTRLITLDNSGLLQVWDLTNGEQITSRINAEYRWYVNFALTPDNHYLVYTVDHSTLRVLDLSTDQYVAGVSEDTIRNFTLSPDGSLLAIQSDNGILLLDFAQFITHPNTEHWFNGASSESLAISPNNTQLTIISLGKIELWDIATSERVSTIDGFSSYMSDIRANPNGDTLLWLDGGRLHRWALDMGTQDDVSPFHPWWFCGRFSGSGLRFTTIDCYFLNETDMRTWDSISGEEIGLTIPSGYTEVYSLNWDGTLLGGIVSSASTIYLWNIAEGAELYTFEAHSNRVELLAFSPNNDFFAAGFGNGYISVWDTLNGDTVYESSDMLDSVSAIAFSADNTRLAYCGEGNTIHIFETQTWEAIQTLTIEGNCENLAFGLDNRLLAGVVNMDEGTFINLWNTETATLLAQLPNDDRYIASLLFTPDGRRLIYGGEKGIIHIWGIPADE